MSELTDTAPRLASRRRQIIGASAATLVAQLVRMVGGLLVIPVLLRYLGVEQYGFVAFIISLLTIFVLLESILTPVLRNELVKARAVGSDSRIQESLTVGQTAAVALVVLAVPLVSSLSVLDWNTILTVPAQLPAKSAVIAGTCIGILAAATGFVDCMYAAWNDLARLRIYETIATACGLVAVVIMAQWGVWLVWIVVAMTIPVPAVRIGAWMMFLKRKNLHTHLSWSITMRFFQRHGGSSASFAGTQALASIASLFPLILINHLHGLADVSTFTVTQRLIGAPANLVIALFPVMWPQIARAWELGQRDWVSKAVTRISLMIALGTLLAMILAFAVGPMFFDIWTKGKIVVAAPFLALFAMLCGVQVIQGWFSTMLNALGEFKYQLFCYAAFTAASVAAGSVGLKVLGLDGLVLGLTLATSLFAVTPMAVRAHMRIHRSV